MADLLQQFELETEERQGSVRPRAQPMNPFEEAEAAFQQARRPQRRPQDVPIFKREDPNFHLPSGILHMTVSNSCATIVMVGNIIRRFNINDPRSIESYEIKREREDDRIYRIFQDVTAQHLLICMENKECYYLGRAKPGRRAQLRPLAKVRAQIESVGWNKVEQTEQSTGPILLGTSSGSIFETDIDFQDSLLPKKKAYFTEVYQLLYDLAEHSEPVTGLWLEPFPNRQSQNEVKYYILATTPKRIYQFIGVVTRGDTPQFIELFTHYETVKVQFLEIPGNLKDSQLHVWPCVPRRTPQQFAWLTGAGVYFGTLGFGDHQPGESLFVEKTLIPYGHEDHSEVVAPIGMCLTEFHCLLLYRDRVEVICVLNHKRVFEDQLNVRRDGPLYAMCRDPFTCIIYTHQKMKAWQYMPIREARNIWKIYLEQGEYEKAKRFAEPNQEYLDIIMIRQAEHYFKQKRYQDAAISFSQSQLSFEEVTLKFLQVDRKDALKTFLVKKLESLGEKDSTQQTMLMAWLVELFLNDLGTLKDEGDTRGHHTMQQDFHKFLESPALRECLEANKKTVYDLISSHGAVEDMVFFAILMKDYEKVITHYIQLYRYNDALKVLTEKASEALQHGSEAQRRSRFKRFESLFYKFSPALMRECAPRTVDAWIQMGKHLTPTKLIPALIQCNQPTDQKQVSAAIRYLEHCVFALRNNDRSIHNFLISAYAKSSASQDHKKLLEYLVRQSREKVVCYDPQYALRLCAERNLDEACVYIYAAMGLWEESVDLALKVDVELARQVAGSPVRNKDMQRKMWLKVAQHVIKKEENIEKAMMFLKECSLLKIEDILPFFPDFVTIDHFKDAICTSLSEYNAHIDDLKAEMQAATDSARNIRADIQDIRNKCVVVHSNTKCQICNGRLLSQGFYMFPCTHAFHRECLITEVKQHLSGREKAELEQLLVVAAQASTAAGEGGTRGGDDIKAKVDSIVGAECLYCGDWMIQSIDQLFIPPEQFEASRESWK